MGSLQLGGVVRRLHRDRPRRNRSHVLLTAVRGSGMLSAHEIRNDLQAVFTPVVVAGPLNGMRPAAILTTHSWS
jgi:hypothetical protein